MTSPEDAVQIPAGRPELALLIKALAEHPVAVPVLVLDAVIIARPRFLPPPERGRAGEGVRLGDRARNRTPTRRWPSAIATLPLAGGGITPPFRRDALRAFGLDHAARHMPPGEARRRSFWNFGKHGQRLGPGEEKLRPSLAWAKTAQARRTGRRKRFSGLAPIPGCGFPSERGGARRARPSD